MRLLSGRGPRRRPRVPLRTLAACGAAATVAAVVAPLATTTGPHADPGTGGITDGRAPGPVHHVRVVRMDGVLPPGTVQRLHI